MSLCLSVSPCGFSTEWVSVSPHSLAQTERHAHPYDALLELYEPGETVASLRALFARLRAGLKPLQAAAAARLPQTRHDFLRREGAFPTGTVCKISLGLASFVCLVAAVTLAAVRSTSNDCALRELRAVSLPVSLSVSLSLSVSRCGRLRSGTAGRG